MQIYNQNENLWLDNYNCKTISYHRHIILLEVIFFFLPYAEILYLHGGWNASLCELEQIVTLVINRVRTMVEWTGKIKCLSLYLCPFPEIYEIIFWISEWMAIYISYLCHPLESWKFDHVISFRVIWFLVNIWLQSYHRSAAYVSV